MIEYKIQRLHNKKPETATHIALRFSFQLQTLN